MIKHHSYNPYNQIPGVDAYRKELSELCYQVYRNKHPQAEHQFLSIAEKIFHEETHTSTPKTNHLTALCDILYSEFNDYFIAWAAEHELPTEEQTIVYKYANYFLETAQNPKELEDIIWELSHSVMNKSHLSSDLPRRIESLKKQMEP